MGFSFVTGSESIMHADNASFDGTHRDGALNADGQLWIGSTASRHVKRGNITSTGGTVTVTNGSGTINLEAGTAVPTTFTEDSGTATPAANNLNVFGGTGIDTSGAGDTITIAVDGAVVGQTITGDSGGALSPTAGNWNILGSTVASGTSPLVTSGAGSTLTINAQRSQALAAADSTKVGLSNYDSAAFSVDANGFTTWTLDWKDAVYAATTATLNATYNNGSSGIGATLTNAGALAAFAVDGTTVAVGLRVLVKDQGGSGNTAHNGIYTVTVAGSGAVAWVLTRSTDYNRIFQIGAGNIVPVINGTTQGNTSWIEASIPAIIGTDGITFGQYTFSPGSYVQYRVLIGGSTPTSPIDQVASLGTAGQVLTSNGAGAAPTFENAAGGLTWSEETASPVSAAVGHGYIANLGSLLTFNLPGTFAVGDIIHIVGKGAGLWVIDAPAGDTIHFGNQDTSSGGTITATNRYDAIQIIGTVANSEWTVTGVSQGNLTVA